MTNAEYWMRELENRDYSDVKQDLEFLHLIKIRDRLAYFSLQLYPFFYQDPWDLPAVVNGQRYPPAALMTLQMGEMSVVKYYDLLTDIEAALITAAGRRGIVLQRRGKRDEEGGYARPPQSQKSTRRSVLDG